MKNNEKNSEKIKKVTEKFKNSGKINEND